MKKHSFQQLKLFLDFFLLIFKHSDNLSAFSSPSAFTIGPSDLVLVSHTSDKV